MIDADIRHIIEPELMEGEELLWADKTSQKELDAAIEFANPADNSSEKDFTYIAIVLGTFLVVLSNDIGEIVVTVFTVGLSTGFVIWFLRWQAKTLSNFNIGGYVLTNKRLFELDKKLKIKRRFDARKLQHVYEGAACVILRPISKGLFKRYKLIWLKSDVYATINYIDSELKRVRGQEKFIKQLPVEKGYSHE